jgi:hypothetical protein
MKQLFIFFSFVIFLNSSASSFAEDKFVESAKVDLDGDGTTEHITISGMTEFGDFLLTIEQTSITGKFDPEAADGFIIVDIDTGDQYKEVAVHTPGPSSDDEYLIYWYDGKSIQNMGRLSRWPEFLGNGIVHVEKWMGFWSQNNKYVLDKKTRKLNPVPQDIYYVGVEVDVKKSFPIYKTRDCKERVAYLKPESKIMLFACDPSSENNYSSWPYLIKSSTNLIGWAKEKDFSQKVEGLPLAD